MCLGSLEMEERVGNFIIAFMETETDVWSLGTYIMFWPEVNML